MFKLKKIWRRCLWKFRLEDEFFLTKGDWHNNVFGFSPKDKHNPRISRSKEWQDQLSVVKGADEREEAIGITLWLQEIPWKRFWLESWESTDKRKAKDSLCYANVSKLLFLLLPTMTPLFQINYIFLEVTKLCIIYC